MDITITAIAIAFLTMLGLAALLFLKDEPASQLKNTAEPIAKKDDLSFALQKKITNLEQKLTELTNTLQNSQSELKQSREREKAATQEKSQISFDAQQYEKFKEEHAVLKDELKTKEDSLEKEITLRRQQSTELIQLKQDFESIKKRAIEAEDAFRKSQTMLEATSKELKETKKAFDEQQKIINQHHENKIEGEWVSRNEFEAVQKELKEKESMLQKFLSIKK